MKNRIRKEVEKRLSALKVTPAKDGSDLGNIDLFIDDTLLLFSSEYSVKELTEELIYAVADVAAAELASLVFGREKGAGAVSSKDDGTLSVGYAKGTTTYERTLSSIDAMKKRGFSVAKKYRRLRW